MKKNKLYGIEQVRKTTTIKKRKLYNNNRYTSSHKRT